MHLSKLIDVNAGSNTITDLGADALSEAIHAKAVSCREVMQAYLDRIARVNPHVNAIINLQDADSLLAQADVRDAQLANGHSMGWMHGMPQAIKDLAMVAGIPMTQGSPLLKNNIPSQDCLMVERMKAAGCIVIGKTNTPEFGLGSHTFNPLFGATRNPYDLGKTAGGSSGGAAVALACRLLPVADGSDFMGSLRNPAAWNNVFGMRPSQGRVPSWPASDAYIAQLSTEGPMGRSVRDIAMLLSIQAGYDTRAPLSLGSDGRQYSAPIAGPAQPWRIGWLGDLDGYLAMEDGILDSCKSGLNRLEGIGCVVDSLPLGTAPAPIWQAWLVWRRALVASRLLPFTQTAEQRALLKPEALWECGQAGELSAAQLLAASAQRTAFYNHMCKLFVRHDFLVLPTAQVWPFEVSQHWPKRIGEREMDSYHRWMEVVIYATFAGLPCINVPVGFNAQGLPMGMQIIGRPRGDMSVLQLAHAYEAVAQDLLARRPAESTFSAQ
ncbi:Glutamyl-tRNA(Gln) amidotransferase subunit A [Polaromonas vacuolata]|uniref:Glutamyl-tRNA(Gln) amidotransferase subunit A n=1 Tax=Polaromonas vacuolata TaxID=37448 RepID=A0A6H2H701_9BURK|nr:amidase [Polaromonas vacuolata]QJC55638.1 Glutamyl-tRNA(Gln) amidotransferase subunit A [Polaromonas vacuolata]